jgi:amphi-Trp domain-containing protein
MNKKSKLFKSKERQLRSEVAAFLSQFVERLETGEVVFRRGAEELVLDIPASLIFEVEVEKKVKKSKGLQHTLEIEIKWFEDDTHSSKLELG